LNGNKTHINSKQFWANGLNPLKRHYSLPNQLHSAYVKLWSCYW